jgi:hypothetical protein
MTADPLGMIDGPNVYCYLNNNPINDLDPWGLCGGFWSNLWNGNYFGTKQGQESAAWWAQQYEESKTWYEKLSYGFGGVLASLWTPQTWKQTSLTLGTGYALSGWAAKTGPWLGTIAIHQAHHGLGSHLELILKVGEKTLKVVMPGKDKLIFWSLK